MIKIESYREGYKDGLIELILNIEQYEFNVPVTIADQPDLLAISKVYCGNSGNFWVALDNENIVGTIGLIDISNGQSALRKMFVHKSYRGKEIGVGQALLNVLLEWCNQKHISEVFLGTIERMHAAHRFYIRNGFIEIKKEELPQTFPLMPVDNTFFRLIIEK